MNAVITVNASITTMEGSSQGRGRGEKERALAAYDPAIQGGILPSMLRATMRAPMSGRPRVGILSAKSEDDNDRCPANFFNQVSLSLSLLWEVTSSCWLRSTLPLQQEEEGGGKAFWQVTSGRLSLSLSPSTTRATVTLLLPASSSKQPFPAIGRAPARLRDCLHRAGKKSSAPSQPGAKWS